MSINPIENLKKYEVEQKISSNVTVSPLEKKIRNKERLKYRYYKHIGKIGKNKDFEKVYDIDMMVDQLINILNINKRTYPFSPELGSDIIKYVFEQRTEEVTENVKEEVKWVVEQYLPTMYIVKMESEYIKKDKMLVINTTVQWEDQEKTIDITFDKENYKYLI